MLERRALCPALPAARRSARRRLERLLARSRVPCLRQVVPAFDDGKQLLDGVVAKRRASAYRSGPSRDWRKVKPPTWREANRERWRLF